MAIPGYQIVRKIRQGGMSTVYLAVQKSVGREVALKVMSPALSSDPSFGDRFYREAKIVGQLSHPNIVSIYDVGAYKQYNYIAMDYLPGAPLQDRLRDGVELRDAMRIAKDVAAALDYTHQRGYLHRDIKPDNILFREDGSTVLCDFGIARAVKSNLKMTNMGSVLGTPHYMSPEQAQGKTIDGRTDLYSLGVVFYEMLTGNVPFPGDDPIEVAIKHLSNPPPKLPSHLKVFQPFIDKILAKKPAARFQSGRDVIDALERLEQTLGRRHQEFRTNTDPSTVQVLSLFSALFSTLGSVTWLKFKRLLTGADPQPRPLTQSDQKKLDDFVLAEEEDPSTTATVVGRRRTTPQPIKPRTRYWLYLPALLVVSAMAGFLYLSEHRKATLQQWYLDAVAALLPEAIPPSAPAPAAAAPTPPPAEAEREPVPTPTPPPPTPEPEPEPEPAPPPPQYALTVNTKPTDARIRILNIKPRYEPGIELEPGAYHIEVTAEDYEKETRWIRIDDQNMTVAVALKKIKKAIPPGTVITLPMADGGSTPETIALPKGSLTVSDTKTLTVEGPVALGVYEVTFAQYDRFAEATGRPLPDDEGWGRDRQPVIGVSWAEAQAYTQWLSEQTGKTYRLPRRDEWEYAARAGSTTDYWWGDKSAEKRANCRRGCDSDWSKLFSASTAPVGSFTPNPYGLHDTAGNVAEWLAECADGGPATAAQCERFLVAGGSYRDAHDEIYNSRAEIVDGGAREDFIGFRVLLELDNF